MINAVLVVAADAVETVSDDTSVVAAVAFDADGLGVASFQEACMVDAALISGVIDHCAWIDAAVFNAAICQFLLATAQNVDSRDDLRIWQ